MPTYDYECKSCKHKFEYFQAMTDDVLTVCPECQGELRRLIGGGSGVIFKGSGFYVNDTKSAANPAGSTLATNQNSSSKKPTDNSNSKSETVANNTVKSESSKTSSSNTLVDT